MSDIELPTSFTLTLHTDDDLLSDIKITQLPDIHVKDLLSDVRIKELPEITLHTDDDLLSNIRIKELPTIKLDAKTDSKVDAKLDLGLDNIRVKELPVVRLKFGVDPTRVHMPAGWKFGVSVLGLQLFSFDVCGESMVVVEDYKPHKTEQCD